MIEEFPKLAAKVEPHSRPDVEASEARLAANIERVHQQYGSDLSSFLRDVQQELALKRDHR